MPRNPNTRPTNIYWLYDTRTNLPFYCGKTVYDVEFRLKNHHRAAVKAPHRPISIRLTELGANVRVQTMEIVPLGEKWADRERFWISTLRLLYPASCVNVSNGGDGPAGYIHTAETRAKLSVKNTGKKMHPRTLAALVAANTGRPKTTEELAAIGAAHRGKIVTEITREKLRLAKIGKPQSEESKAKQSSALMGRKLSSEHVDKLRRPASEDKKEKIRTALTGRKHSAERIANIRAAVIGKKRPPRTPEHCARIAENKRQWWASRKAKESVNA